MIPEKLRRDLAALEGDSTLFEREQMRRRIEVLDALEAHLGDAGAEASGSPPEMARVLNGVLALRRRLEEANAPIFQTIRREIQQGNGAETLLRWIDSCRDSGEMPAPGLGYDALDELVAGILRVREPGCAPAAPAPEQVFYQPTPVRHVLQLIRLSGLREDDVLIDLGSGLGHVCMLASILTRVRATGIEVEAAYVASARACAESLGLSRVNFVAQDAREADLSAGTVFWLYTPFSGSILKKVLQRLEHESTRRPLRICSLGPCTRTLAEQAWLRANTACAIDRVTGFMSR